MEHLKKMIAPVVITTFVVMYYIVYFVLIINFVGGIFKILLGIFPLIFAILMIYVCVQRIIEIEEGEEDDLSKY